MKGCVKIVKDKPITKSIRLDGLISDTIYDIAIQGTNRAGDGTLSRAVTAQTKDYEKRPLIVGFLNQNSGKSYVVFECEAREPLFRPSLAHSTHLCHLHNEDHLSNS